MSVIPEPIQKLVDEFSKLPGIGPKTASRLVFYLLSLPKQEIQSLGGAVLGLAEGLKRCSLCHNISEQDSCQICSDPKRDHNQLMVVEEPLDILALEKTGYKGLYHVLGGVISPLRDISPEQLTIDQLMRRLRNSTGDVDKPKSALDNNIVEVILATDPSLEGEATAMYIQKEISKSKIKNQKLKNLKVTRIARGLPVGGDLEYADEVTLQRALEGRQEY